MIQNLMTRFLKETIPSGGEKPWPLDVPLNKPGSTKAPGTCRLWSRALGWRSCVAGLRQLGWALIESSGWDMILDMILGCLGHGFWDMLGYRVEWFLLGFWMRDKPRFFFWEMDTFFLHPCCFSLHPTNMTMKSSRGLNNYFPVRPVHSQGS